MGKDMCETREPQKSVKITPPDLTNLSSDARRDVYAMAGKEIASSIGARTLITMLNRANMSLLELSEKSGFDIFFLTDIVSGRLPAGPDLWMLVALGEAMELDVSVSFTPRSCILSNQSQRFA
ncbi:hypothetical protein [Rhizobium sp. MHM7A]|uniref:hypothetical protein n=1 Tax=Rhizobium sp. MHM7A TaxID=2583233 RepID=UPI0011068C6B|nr:hypothetical protein [Rhizobium sp. MHM7A]TLX16032.1 hypothetical protein FFR93_01560 [Rhizobium sp. MHM7A]